MVKIKSTRKTVTLRMSDTMHYLLRVMAAEKRTTTSETTDLVLRAGLRTMLRDQAAGELKTRMQAAVK